jgi:hypothetical protein
MRVEKRGKLFYFHWKLGSSPTKCSKDYVNFNLNVNDVGNGVGNDNDNQRQNENGLASNLVLLTLLLTLPPLSQ